MSFTGIFDNPEYAKLALKNSEIYQKADPFPHIVIDNFLEKSLACKLSETFPKYDDQKIDWVEGVHKNSIKKYQHDETKLPLSIREMLREFNSRQFVLFLEVLTGIDNLIPDPYFIGGGAHLSGTGDFLNIHTDFNWHHKLFAHRRINVLLYLSEGWEDSWNGFLELYDKDMNNKVKAIKPLMNRLVVFSTSEHSFHGHPKPLATPKGIYRKTLNLYYYTSYRNESEIADPHFTKYRTESSPFSVGLKTNYKKQAEI